MAEIFGTNFPDTLTGTDAADQIRGWAADNPPGDEGPRSDRDVIDGGAGNDSLWGGAGADDLTSGLGDDRLYGGSGADTLRAGDGNDIAAGGSGDDVLLDFGQGARLSGNSGNDTIVFEGGSATGILSGGHGVDLLQIGLWDLWQGVSLSFRDSSQVQTLSTGTRITGFERVDLEGTSGDDHLEGGSYSDTIYGSDGDDTILGGQGDDHLQGGWGENTLRGGRGDDYLVATPFSNGWDGYEIDIIIGGKGDDTLFLVWEGDLTLSMAEPGTRQDLPDGSSFKGIERLSFRGGYGTDSILGGTLSDYLDGGDGGQDTLVGGGGNDWLLADGYRANLDGGEGDDMFVIRYSLHGSSLVGGAGVDTLQMNWVYLSGSETLVLDLRDPGRTITISGGTTLTGIERLDVQLDAYECQIIGGAFSDHIETSGANDSLHGSGGDDSLNGGGGNDLLFGGHGDDTLVGGWNYSFQDQDSLFGGLGNDRISDGKGNDLLSGGQGSDVLTGGEGVDSFLFDTAPRASEVDTITDFAHEQDLVLLLAAAFPGLTPGPLSADIFVQARHAQDADDHLIWHRATGLLCYDPDGSGAQAEVAIAQLSTRHLTASDILII